MPAGSVGKIKKEISGILWTVLMVLCYHERTNTQEATHEFI